MYLSNNIWYIVLRGVSRGFFLGLVWESGQCGDVGYIDTVCGSCGHTEWVQISHTSKATICLVGTWGDIGLEDF